MALQRRTRPLVGYGLDNSLQGLAPIPITTANRAPTTADTAQLGTIWIWPAQQEAWVLVSNSNATATWNLIEASGSAGVFTSLTVNPGPVTTSGTGAVNISADATATTINIGTGAAAKTVTVGSTNTTSSTAISGGSGGIEIDSGTGTIGIADNATNSTLNIGTGGGAKIVTLGSTNTNSETTVQSGTGGVFLASGATTKGLIAVTPATATAASPTATVTSNTRVISATFTGFSTANSGGAQTYTISSTEILTTSACFVTVTNLNASTNGAFLTITGIIQATGSLAIHTANNGAGALGTGDNVLVNVWIID